MDLANWQNRLFSHFADLRKNRPSDEPIYGLEHCLNHQELDDLEESVHAEVTKGYYDTRSLWLPLVIYASEIGYRYTGDEYWRTFSEETPHWNLYGSREWIRSCFRKFSKQFGGMKPSGAWANHFSIICWPITHAILPKDLQRELARLLYESRFSFSPELFRSAEAFGQHLERRSSYSTSRFRIFAQEHLLLGEISTSLLFHGQRDAEPPVLATTLQRIVDDLEEEQRSKAWLLDAQRRAREIKLSGVTRNRPFGATRVGQGEQLEEGDAFSVEPRVLLRPDNESWRVFLEFVNLSRLVDFEPKLRSARPTVIGSSRRLARSWHLYEPCRVQLEHWPHDQAPLVHFDISVPEIDSFLKAQCFLRPAPNWLFKIGSDGLAHEIRSGKVRPGYEYICLMLEHDWSNQASFPRIHLSCTGVAAAKLDIPRIVPEDFLKQLAALNLTLGTTLDVWPVGLPAPLWDGEGSSEWLTSDPPCLGIKIDTTESVHISLELDGNESTELQTLVLNGSEPVFVELPPLSVGEHRIKVSVGNTPDASNSTEGYLALTVKEPQPWDVLRYEQAPFFISMNPPAPTLEDFWENRATFEIHGPAAVAVSPELHLESKERKALWRRRLPPLELPIEVETWRQHFRTSVLADGQALTNYDRSYSCRLELSVPDFPVTTLTFEREFIEMRWAVSRSGRNVTLHLVDESDHEPSGGPLSIRKYGFNEPDQYETISYEHATAGLNIGAEGGLFTAVRDDRIYGVIMPLEFTSFQDLKIAPDLQPRTKTEAGITDLIQLCELWTGARVVGGLGSTLRQRDVLKRIQLELVFLAGGKRWADAEVRLENDEFRSLPQLAQEISHIATEGRIGSELFKRRVELAKMEVAERKVVFGSLLNRYLVPGDAAHPLTENEIWFAEFALRFCSWPAGIREWSDARYQDALRWLLRSPAIARAARFFVVVTDSLSKAPIQAVPLYTGWEWE